VTKIVTERVYTAEERSELMALLHKRQAGEITVTGKS
jgi:hypothetical protein